MKITEKLCKYDDTEKATRLCDVCGEGLCNGCGYIIAGHDLCNECANDSELAHDFHAIGACYQCKMD